MTTLVALIVMVLALNVALFLYSRKLKRENEYLELLIRAVEREIDEQHRKKSEEERGQEAAQDARASVEGDQTHSKEEGR